MLLVDIICVVRPFLRLVAPGWPEFLVSLFFSGQLCTWSDPLCYACSVGGQDDVSGYVCERSVCFQGPHYQLELLWGVFWCFYHVCLLSFLAGSGNTCRPSGCPCGEKLFRTITRFKLFSHCCACCFQIRDWFCGCVCVVYAYQFACCFCCRDVQRTFV